MNTKTIVVLVLIFLGANLALFLVANKKLPSPSSIPQFNTSSQTASILPVNATHKGVNSVTLLYQFTGKVTDIRSVGENKKITLDISDSQTPDFVTNATTFVTGSEGPGGTQRKSIQDVKVGSKVVILSSYDLVKKTWNLTSISILD